MADSTSFGGSLDFGAGSSVGSFDPTLGGALPSYPASDPGGIGALDTGGSTGGINWGQIGTGAGQVASGVGSAITGAASTLGPLALVYNAYSQMNSPVAEQGPLEQIGSTALNAGTTMVNAASKGQLTQPQQAAVDVFKANAKAENDQYLAKAGLSDSSSAVASDTQINENALAMSQKFISDTMTSGLSALNIAQSPYAAIANAQVQRDLGLQEAIANAMGAWGAMQGSSGGGSSGSGIGGLIQAGAGIATIASAFSDRRLKRNIVKLGILKNGLNVYSFDYVWGEHAIGVMADEVEKIMPEAVGERLGFKTVNYGML